MNKLPKLDVGIIAMLVLFMAIIGTHVLFRKQTPPPKVNIPTGNIYYVSVTGNDSNRIGTLDHPWRTIKTGVNSASPGDTIIVMDGVYDEVVLIKSGITLKSYNTSKATIVGSFLLQPKASNITVQGFNFFPRNITNEFITTLK